MITSTSSTAINVRTVLLCDSVQPRSVAASLRPGAVARARMLAAEAEYPSAAVIHYLTQQIIATILFAVRDSDPGKHQN